MRLSDFWPTQRAVDECILTEAETLSEAIFLAIHQEMRFFRRKIGGTTARAGSADGDRAIPEHGLLEAFLSPALPSGTLLLPILGSSGVGKSHAIRWLDIQLKRLADADARHVIRIPKSASLKQVLQLILDGLPGQKYANVREALAKAREKVDLLDAREGLKAKLLVALQRRFDTAERRMTEARQANRQISENDKRSHTHCRRDCLQALLNDPVASQQWLGDDGVIMRLARTIAEPSLPDIGMDRQFHEKDLPSKSALKLEEVAKPTRAYLNLLDREDGRFRREAVEELNAVIDDALHQMLDMGETRLTDLFAEVRTHLLEDGKELVLLVEDFAALAGVQRALLDVMIKEARRDGRQVLCNMRTALAVTEGYLTNFDTVATRAVFEWRLDSPKADAEVIGAIANFVGAYLNAARHGATELERWFRERSTLEEAPKVPRFVEDGLEEQEVAQLNAFGRCSQTLPLFPYNRAAIEQLANQHLRTADGSLDFRPREIINHLLRNVLLSYEGDFRRQAFPPPRFYADAQRELDADVRRAVNERVQSNEEHSKRYFALLRFWGGAPQRPADIRLSPDIYEAFGLKPLDFRKGPGDEEGQGDGGTAEDEDVSDGHEPPPPRVTPPTRVTPPPPSAPPGILDTIRRWAAGAEMGQQDANEIRGLVVDSVAEAINWDAALLRNPDIARADLKSYLRQWVWIPRARGGAPTATTDTAFVTVCRDEDLASIQSAEKVDLTLRALVRYHREGHWRYAEAATDYALYANFVERSAAQATRFLQERYYRAAFDPIPMLAQASLIGARILNCESAHGDLVGDDALAASAVFAESGPPQDRGEGRWQALRDLLHSGRGQMQEAMLNLIGARQGGENKVYAIDAVRLLRALGDTRQAWKLQAAIPQQFFEDYPRVLPALRELRQRLDAAVTDKRRLLDSVQRLVVAQVGAVFDAGKLAAEMKESIERAKALGLLGADVDEAKLCRILDAFASAPVSQALADIAGLSEARDDRDGNHDDFGAVLSAVARADEATLLLMREAVTQYGSFVDYVSRVIDNRMGAIPSNVYEITVSGIRAELDSLGATVAQLSTSIAGES